MLDTLNALSDQEIGLYNFVTSLEGSMETKEHCLREKGVFKTYNALHRSYFELFEQVENQNTKLEALKRLLFINWYALSEPSCFTGIDDLDKEIVFSAYEKLNDYIAKDKLDEELLWMVSYYACWDYIILWFSDPRLPALTRFVKAVDTSIVHFPIEKLPKLAMENRGQLGIYWKSVLGNDM